MNVQTKRFLNSKRNIKRRPIKVYYIIRQHDAICKKLNQFNDFWKFYLQIQILFFLIIIWFIVYEVAFDIKLSIYTKLFFSAWLSVFILMFICIIYLVYIVSQEVNTNFCFILYFIFYILYVM